MEGSSYTSPEVTKISHETRSTTAIEQPFASPTPVDISYGEDISKYPVELITSERLGISEGEKPYLREHEEMEMHEKRKRVRESSIDELFLGDTERETEYKSQRVSLDAFEEEIEDLFKEIKEIGNVMSESDIVKIINKPEEAEKEEETESETEEEEEKREKVESKKKGLGKIFPNSTIYKKDFIDETFITSEDVKILIEEDLADKEFELNASNKSFFKSYFEEKIKENPSVNISDVYLSGESRLALKKKFSNIFGINNDLYEKLIKANLYEEALPWEIPLSHEVYVNDLDLTKAFLTKVAITFNPGFGYEIPKKNLPIILLDYIRQELYMIENSLIKTERDVYNEVLKNFEEKTDKDLFYKSLKLHNVGSIRPIIFLANMVNVTIVSYLKILISEAINKGLFTEIEAKPISNTIEVFRQWNDSFESISKQHISKHKFIYKIIFCRTKMYNVMRSMCDILEDNLNQCKLGDYIIDYRLKFDVVFDYLLAVYKNSIANEANFFMKMAFQFGFVTASEEWNTIYASSIKIGKREDVLIYSIDVIKLMSEADRKIFNTLWISHIMHFHTFLLCLESEELLEAIMEVNLPTLSMFITYLDEWKMHHKKYTYPKKRKFPLNTFQLHVCLDVISYYEHIIALEELYKKAKSNYLSKWKSIFADMVNIPKNFIFLIRQIGQGFNPFLSYAVYNEIHINTSHISLEKRIVLLLKVVDDNAYIKIKKGEHEVLLFGDSMFKKTPLIPHENMTLFRDGIYLKRYRNSIYYVRKSQEIDDSVKEKFLRNESSFLCISVNMETLSDIVLRLLKLAKINRNYKRDQTIENLFIDILKKYINVWNMERRGDLDVSENNLILEEIEFNTNLRKLGEGVEFKILDNIKISTSKEEHSKRRKMIHDLPNHFGLIGYAFDNKNIAWSDLDKIKKEGKNVNIFKLSTWKAPITELEKKGFLDSINNILNGEKMKLIFRDFLETLVDRMSEGKSFEREDPEMIAFVKLKIIGQTDLIRKDEKLNYDRIRFIFVTLLHQQKDMNKDEFLIALAKLRVKENHKWQHDMYFVYCFFDSMYKRNTIPYIINSNWKRTFNSCTKSA